jgi:hypothetical protein
LGLRQERELRIRRDANWLLLNAALLRAGVPPADTDSRALDLLARADPGVVAAVVRWLEPRGSGGTGEVWSAGSAPAPATALAGLIGPVGSVGSVGRAERPADHPVEHPVEHPVPHSADPRLGYQVEAC